MGRKHVQGRKNIASAGAEPRNRNPECPSRVVKRILCVGALLAVISCASRRPPEEFGYPRWFLGGMGEHGISCTVGYGRVFVDPDTSVAYALQDGLGRRAMERAITIRSEQGFVSVPSGWRSMGELFSEEVDSLGEDAGNREPSPVVDSAFVDGMTLVLLCSSAEEAVEGDFTRVPMPKDAPDWVRKLPEEKGSIFAVGTSPLYYHRANSWREAERMARLELAREVLLQVRDLSRQAGGTMEQIIVTRTEATLRGIQIVGRWLDGKEKACYALCRMPIR
ncbi:MAG: LPP20 family lipoprotein [Candidatus Latescibacterota bacterium]